MTLFLCVCRGRQGTKAWEARGQGTSWEQNHRTGNSFQRLVHTYLSWKPLEVCGHGWTQVEDIAQQHGLYSTTKPRSAEGEPNTKSVASKSRKGFSVLHYFSSCFFNFIFDSILLPRQRKQPSMAPINYLMLQHFKHFPTGHH